MRFLLSLALFSALTTACAGSEAGDRNPPPDNNGDDEVDASVDSGGDEIDADTTPATLFFSEIVDHPTNANLKYVEIYNPTGAVVSLTGWSIRRYANGTSTLNGNDTYNFTAGAMINDEQAFVVAGSGTEFTESYPAMAADLVVAVTINGNGNDVYELFDGTEVVDVYGVVGEDGTGKAWEYTKKAAVRDAGVTHGNPTWTAAEWAIGTTTSPKAR